MFKANNLKFQLRLQVKVLAMLEMVTLWPTLHVSTVLTYFRTKVPFIFYFPVLYSSILQKTLQNIGKHWNKWKHWHKIG